jgi:hypothetical protein
MRFNFSFMICTLTEVLLNLNEVFLNPNWGVFPCFFLSCKANARVKLAKKGHGPHSSTLVVICVVPLLFVFFLCYLCCSMYCLCVNVYCHRVTTQLQLINISYLLARCVGKLYLLYPEPSLQILCSGTVLSAANWDSHKTATEQEKLVTVVEEKCRPKQPNFVYVWCRQLNVLLERRRSAVYRP